MCCAAAVFAACEKNDKNEAATGIENGHDWVNLSLPSGTKWATCNVGASKPEEYGNYYAWGETTTKDYYSWETYKYGTYNGGKDYSKLTKYNTSDGKTTLEAADDAATVNWGGKWRMPTDAEWAELIEKCTWTWTTQNGVNGYKVQATNGNSIFLPAAGIWGFDHPAFTGESGYYWSSSLGTRGPDYAWSAYLFSDEVYRSDDGDGRCYGQSVRPVCK